MTNTIITDKDSIVEHMFSMENFKIIMVEEFDTSDKLSIMITTINKQCLVFDIVAPNGKALMKVLTLPEAGATDISIMTMSLIKLLPNAQFITNGVNPISRTKTG